MLVINFAFDVCLPNENKRQNTVTC